ncbi:MAG: SIR2 family protein [Pseudomonadota bacterium]
MNSDPFDGNLKEISPIEFVKRFAHGICKHGHNYTWFLGAGCSITSGIPAAGSLTKKWLNELFEMQTGGDRDFDDWLASNFAGYDQANPAQHYATAFRERHPHSRDRQREIELVCSLGEPGYGYATFAQLLCAKQIGERCNTVLTTNFDDLVADALYLHGSRRNRPQVITHEALSRYVRIQSPRPTIVKLHGDAHFEPKNLGSETSQIDRLTKEHLYPFLRDACPIFVGYGGGDESIADFFESAPEPGLGTGAYWIGLNRPSDRFVDWLQQRDAFWVNHLDFDRLMHLLRGELKLSHPDEGRWADALTRYYDRYSEFEKEVHSDPEGELKDKLKAATDSASETLPDDEIAFLQAYAKERLDPDFAENFYRKSIRKHKNSARLLGQFARFLINIKKDPDRAEKYYIKAIDTDPSNAINLGNYANFLRINRQNMDEAEKYYLRALNEDPMREHVLGNYASFLQIVRKDFQKAESYYRRGFQNNLNAPDFHGNFAQLLFVLGRRKEAIASLEKAVDLMPRMEHSDTLAIELCFYRFAHSVGKYRDTLAELKALVADGKRSIGWDFSRNVERASKEEHPEIGLVGDLAKVISGETDARILTRYKSWNKIK